MTDHSLFQDDLKAYADGELPLPRRLAVRRHLTHCASCREELTQMTQISEDLRASEPADALDPALRAKILGIAPETAPDSAGQEGRTQGLPLRPTPPGLGAGGRNRLALRWALAGAALLAWFVFFPVFQHVRENARSADNSAEAYKPQGQEANPPPAVRFSAARPAPAGTGASPVSRHEGSGGGYPGGSGPSAMTERLSGRGAVIDKNGNVDGNASVRAFSPISKFKEAPSAENKVTVNSTAGNIQTFDAFNASTYAPQRQVHKEATIGVQVANPEATSDKVADMVKETGGFVAGNTLDTGADGLKTAELTVKVPVAQFETFMGQVARLGNVQSKNITGEDITEKKSDADQTESVLEGDVQSSEARLKALGSRAKWHDEQATRDLRTQLAEARARLVLLKRMAALSTITVDLSQTPKPPAPAPVTGGFLNGLKASTHDALQSLVTSAGALMALVIWLLAYAPLWIPALLVGRYALKEYRKRQAV